MSWCARLKHYMTVVMRSSCSCCVRTERVEYLRFLLNFNAEYAYLTNDFAQLDVVDTDGNKQGKTTGMSDVSADWRMSFTIGSRFTIQPMVYGRLLFGSYVPAVFGNTIGGEWFGHYVEQQMPFAGIGNMEYVRQQFVAAQLQAQERIGKSSFVLLRVSAGQQSEKLKLLIF